MHNLDPCPVCQSHELITINQVNRFRKINQNAVLRKVNMVLTKCGKCGSRVMREVDVGRVAPVQ